MVLYFLMNKNIFVAFIFGLRKIGKQIKKYPKILGGGNFFHDPLT